MLERSPSSSHLFGAGRGLLVALVAVGFMAATGWLAARVVLAPAPATETVPAPVIERSSLLALIDHHGRRLAPAALAKPATLVFFGYTHCPDICPLELATMAAALERLGPLADDVAAFFVSVDPERDTAARLADYVPHFDPRITGLTGTADAVAAAAAAFRAYYAKVESADGSYTVDHFARTLVLDQDARLVAAIPFDSPAEALEAAVRDTLSRAGSS